MKSISLNFTPLPEETSEYMRSSEMPYLKIRIKRMLVPFLICCVAGLLIDYYICICSLCFFAVNIITSAIINRNSIRELEKSPVAVRNQTVDFYEDHIELMYNPGSGFKGTTVKHIPVSTVLFVAECNNTITFITKNAGAISIPKRILQGEDEEKIRNLIENLYSDKYQKI